MKFFLSLLFLLSLSISGCSIQGSSTETAESSQKHLSSESTAPPIIFSILPIERAGAMYEKFLPLKYHLESELKRPVIIRIAKDYESAINELGTGKVHIAALDPAAYAEVRARYKERVTPLVKTAGKDVGASRSVLVSKEGRGIERLIDVKGKRLALGSEQSSFSYLIPLAMLNDVGIRISDFSAVDFLQQEDRVALSVLIGNHDVGAMSEAVARKYKGEGLKIIKTSEAISQLVICASDTLPRPVKNQVVDSLIKLKDRKLSARNGIEGFFAAQDRDFDVIRVMIKNLTGRDYIEYGQRTIKVAVLPLYSAITIYERYDPLMRYLSGKTGHEFKLVVPKDFEDFMRVVKAGGVDFSYQNPYIFALIDSEYDIKPLVTTVDESDDTSNPAGQRFRGVIITRQDSGIRDIKDLKNKKVLITSPMSAGGYLSQKIFLLQRGIDIEREAKIIDAKRQENVILGVYRGEADAGFVREAALEVLKEEVDMKKIKVLAKTTPLPNWPFAQCRDSSFISGGQSLASRVRQALLDLKDTEILRAAKIKGFMSANEADFEPLKQY